MVQSQFSASTRLVRRVQHQLVWRLTHRGGWSHMEQNVLPWLEMGAVPEWPWLLHSLSEAMRCRGYLYRSQVKDVRSLVSRHACVLLRHADQLLFAVDDVLYSLRKESGQWIFRRQ